MTVALFLPAGFRTTDEWLAMLRVAMPNEHVALADDLVRDGAVADVEVALVRGADPGLVTAFPNVGLVQCLWAGVERLLGVPELPDGVPVARMVDPAMADAMAASVVAHVLDIVLLHDRYRAAQRDVRWEPEHPRPLTEVTVAVLGLGSLGTVAARRLRDLGFRVVGVRSSTRTASAVEPEFEVTTDLRHALHSADVAVNLLPLTAATVGILNASAFAAMPAGSSIVNVGRGGHVVDTDLLAALDSGHLRRAVLDVFHTEPLAGDHPFWRHSSVTLTPHVAADTEPATASRIVAENIARWRRGETPAGLVDPIRGY